MEVKILNPSTVAILVVVPVLNTWNKTIDFAKYAPWQSLQNETVHTVSKNNHNWCKIISPDFSFEIDF